MGEVDQVEQVWRGMLWQATNSGMSREQIVRLTVETVRTITRGTFAAMFPEDESVVPEEARMYGELLGLMGFTDATLESLTVRVVDTGSDEPAE